MLICLNDRIAVCAYRALADAGARIPDDVAVVSFDDDELAIALHPGLTTVAVPQREMGALAVRLLLDRPEQGEHLVHMPIRVRGSIRPAGDDAA